VKLVAEAAAEIRGMSLEELAQVTTENAIRLLGLR
jgi:TatD DNase family protein